jgi:hypothetical protein
MMGLARRGPRLRVQAFDEESQRGQVLQSFANPLVADVYARHNQSMDRALLERAGGNALARGKARSDPKFRPVVLRGLDFQDVPAQVLPALDLSC